MSLHDASFELLCIIIIIILYVKPKGTINYVYVLIGSSPKKNIANILFKKLNCVYSIIFPCSALALLDVCHEHTRVFLVVILHSKNNKIHASLETTQSITCTHFPYLHHYITIITVSLRVSQSAELRVFDLFSFSQGSDQQPMSAV